MCSLVPFQEEENRYRGITGEGELIPQETIDRMRARIMKARVADKEAMEQEDEEDPPTPAPAADPIPAGAIPEDAPMPDPINIEPNNGVE